MFPELSNARARGGSGEGGFRKRWSMTTERFRRCRRHRRVRNGLARGKGRPMPFLYVACSFSGRGRNPSKGPAEKGAFFRAGRMRAAVYKARRVYMARDDVNASLSEHSRPRVFAKDEKRVTCARSIA